MRNGQLEVVDIGQDLTGTVSCREARAGERPVGGHPLLTKTLLTSEPFGPIDRVPLEAVGGGRTRQGSDDRDQTGDLLAVRAMTALAPAHFDVSIGTVIAWLSLDSHP